MYHAPTRGRRSGWVFTVLAGMLLVGLLLSPSRAETPDKPGDKKDPPPTDKKDPPKDTPKTEPTTPLPPRQKVITLPSGTSSDVVEMVGVINNKLDAAWKENKIVPSRTADDYEFIRRASLDIVGRIAKPEEIERYLKDPKETRRTQLIDRLLSSPDFPRHWANLYTNWLLGRSSVYGRGPYHEQLATWLEDQFAQNRPFHQVMTDLITAKGKSSDNPQAIFILAQLGEAVPPARRRDDGQFEMIPATSRITRLFLGVQTQCTQCHDHPFDANLRQQQFWGINVFLRQVAREGNPPMERMRGMRTYPTLTLVEDDKLNPTGVIAYEKRIGVFLETKARFIDGKEPAKGVSRRDELARLIQDHDNFPKATVNRVWSVFFGKGFVNPIDDFNDQNPVAHAELLGELGKQYKHYGFDLKKLIRWICNSEAYSLSVVANKTNDKAEHEVMFSRMLLKALSPEQLFELLMVATGTEQGKDAKAQLRDRWLEALVTSFGDDEGNEVSFNGTVVQALMMMNGQDINAAITAKTTGTVAAAMKKSPSPQVRVKALYLAALNRPVGDMEYRRVAEKMPLRPGVKDTPEAAYYDLLWALLNSNEFMLNH